MWESDLGVLPVSWPDQAGEWLSHLPQALTGCGGVGLEGTWAERVVTAKTVAGDRWPSRLLVRPADTEGIRCIVAGDGDEASEDQVRPWREAAARALAEMGRHDQDFGWQAILGPSPRRLNLLRDSPLDGPARLGPVLLEPGGVQMRERSGSTPADVSQYLPGYPSLDLPRHSWPVIASGTARSYDAFAADRKARFDAHRTCALLTLLWREHWVPRAGPQIPMPGWSLPPLQVPQSVGVWGHAEPDTSLPADFNTYDGTEPPLAIPEWAQGAWAALDADPVLATAVSAHYEARSLDYDHPSAAYLGYVAAVEGVGTKLVELTRCEECNAFRDAAKRFRKALKTVMTNSQVRKLSYAYDVRSATAHDGTMFGSEETLGHGWMSPFEYDLRSTFGISLLGGIRNASRRVVTRALMNALGVDAAIE